jgi:S-adenosylmethionine hydrolase
MSKAPLVLFTDYGWNGPYVGLLHAAIRRELPEARIIDLQHDLPPFRPRGAGILLAAQLRWLPPGSVVVAVVDPGVGTARRGLVVDYRGYTLIGPDNGLFAPLLTGAGRVRTIGWRPAGISSTFHGRDWFAPAAARAAQGRHLETAEIPAAQCVGFDWPASLYEIVYSDTFGNLMTGVPGEPVPSDRVLSLHAQEIAYARTFGEVPPGTLFWHVNSLGLLELAVNQGSAAALLGLAPGDRVPGLEDFA